MARTLAWSTPSALFEPSFPSHTFMVASFEFSLQTNLSKRTDQLKTRRVQQSDQVEPSAAAGGTARPFSSHQNLWYRSDGYFANAVAAQRRE